MPDLKTLQAQIFGQIAAAQNEASLEAVRVAALGKKGSVSALLAGLGKMAPDERKDRGAAINALKDEVTEALAARRAILKEAALEARLKAEIADVTLPVAPHGIEAGRIHPVSQVMDELAAIFADMGFAIAEGPDIETDDYNFTKLNFPPDHPARDMQDTFYLDDENLVLRTHTSPVQIRALLGRDLPVYVVCPGRTFRTDALDATHTPVHLDFRAAAPLPPRVRQIAELLPGAEMANLLRERAAWDGHASVRIAFDGVARDGDVGMALADEGMALGVRIGLG